MTPPSQRTTVSIDVAVIGTGPAGCAAGVFCARAGLETLLITNGRSTLQKCAFVENYLGFPAGIAPRDLLELSRAHADEAGCTLRDGTVETVRTVGEGFELDIEGDQVRADLVLAASWSDSDYLAELDVEREPEPEGSVLEVRTDDRGETAVDGLYAAGRITGTHHQAIVNAGDGARVALHVISEVRPEFYNDWVAPAGYYASYDRAIPAGVEEIDHQERQDRVMAGRERLVAFFENRNP